MSIAVGDILKIVAVLSWTDGGIAQNVYNAVIAGSGGPFDEGDIVADAVAWVGTMYANLLLLMHEDIDGSEVRVYEYDGVDDDWDEIGSDSWTFSPTEAGNPLPRGVAGLINAKTLDPDVNGKKYLPGMTEIAWGDGKWPAATVADFVDFADDWLTLFVGGTSGATWQPGIWSPTNTSFFAASGAAIVPFIAAYQRRRKEGVGI